MNPVVQKTVLVTGSRGFIGRMFCEKYASFFNIKTVSLLEQDVSEISFCGIDAVLHLGALVHQKSPLSEEIYFKQNTFLTERLALAAKRAGVPYFLFFSTVAVYGRNGNIGNMCEELPTDTACRPVTAYGRSKFNAEIVLEKLSDDNFVVCIFRPPVVYAPNAPGNIFALARLIRTFPILPFGRMENRRSIVDLSVLLELTANAILEAKSGIHVPQNEWPISTEALVRRIARDLNRPVLLFKLPNFMLLMLWRFFPSKTSSLFGSLCFRSAKSLKQ